MAATQRLTELDELVSRRETHRDTMYRRWMLANTETERDLTWALYESAARSFNTAVRQLIYEVESRKEVE